MIGKVQTWWRARSGRERWLLGGMFALIVIVLMWIVLVRPLVDMRFAARERYELAVQKLARARADADTIARLRREPVPSLGAPLDGFIAQAAIEAGFPIADVQPGGTNTATFVSDSVRPQAFFNWVYTMEHQYGLAVANLHATPNGDRTLRVQVSFRVRRH